MSGFKRQLEEIRNEGMDAFHANADRVTAYTGVKAEYWYEGFDYAQDMVEMTHPATEEEIAQMVGYWEDFYGDEIYA